MKSKRGFTLIEIIICVALIAIIGTASFFGVKAINKKIRVKELKQISEKALAAAEVFLETDTESYNQLHKNQNGVIIPLKMLVNKGLLSLDNTDLTMDKIEDEYVMTMLSGSPGSSGCVDVRSVTSWDESMNQPIYICTKSDGSSSITTINASEIGNVNTASKEPFIYSGPYPNNYVMYNGKGPYRIYYIDVDDSLVLVTGTSGFDNVFNGKTDTLTGYISSNYPDEGRRYVEYYVGPGNFNFNVGSTTDNTEKGITRQDLYNVCFSSGSSGNLVSTYTSNRGYASDGFPYASTTTYNYGNSGNAGSCWFWSYGFSYYGPYSNSSGTSSYYQVYGQRNYSNAYKKIRLDKCMKITSGTGTVYEPFQISDAAC